MEPATDDKTNMTKASNSPIGTPAVEAGRRRAQRSSAYREAQAQLAPYEQLARIVIRRRIDLELTQKQLATGMGTSHSAISRIESGQHGTSVQTLQRLAAALEMRFVMGFEHGPADNPVRELVADARRAGEGAPRVHEKARRGEPRRPARRKNGMATRKTA
jgi:transcriptional regulator with XRE-family HTH domain